jgi:hypothetical protein
VSLYPVVEYPAWADDRRSPGPLFGLADPNGNRNLGPGERRSSAQAGYSTTG